MGALVAGPISGASLDYNGRKLTLILQSIVLLTGWLLITFSKCLETLYAGRFLTGESHNMINVVQFNYYLLFINMTKTQVNIVTAG